jgi:hypothetical protein
LSIGLAIQPALERIERSQLSVFFQVAFGVSATAVLVVMLVKVGLPTNGGIVLTGSLLRLSAGGGAGLGYARLHRRRTHVRNRQAGGSSAAGRCHRRRRVTLARLRSQH